MSGFRLPLPIPEGFTQEPWNLNINDKLARTDLTKIVYDYIKANNLQDPTDKRIVLPDNNIKKLFKMKDGDKLTFFNFQRYMKNALRKKIYIEEGWDFFKREEYRNGYDREKSKEYRKNPYTDKKALEYAMIGYKISTNEVFRKVYIYNVIGYILGVDVCIDP